LLCETLARVSQKSPEQHRKIWAKLDNTNLTSFEAIHVGIAVGGDAVSHFDCYRDGRVGSVRLLV
jgi:hypothetical protein